MISSPSMSSCSTQPHLNNYSKSEDALKTGLLINLVEPSIILRGNPQEAPGTFLRGQLILNLSKPTNIKKLGLKFTGKEKTFWVAGLGNEQQAYTEKRETINCKIQFVTPPTAEQSSQHGKFGFKNLKFKDRSTTNTFSAGSHVFPFEIFIPGDLSETVKAEHGSIEYKLTAEVSRSILLPKLVKKHVLKVIRISPDYEISEGIALSKDYDSTFRYEISIPKSAYPLGQIIPIEIKIIPLIKNLKIHGLRVELLEESIYTANGVQAGVTKVVGTLNIDNLVHKNLLQDQDDNNMGDISYHENFGFSVPNEINCSMNTPLINISHVLKFYFIITLPLKSDQDSMTKLFVRCPITIVPCIEVGQFFDLPNYEEKYCSCGLEYQRVAKLILGETATEGCHNCSSGVINAEPGTMECGNCENCARCSSCGYRRVATEDAPVLRT